MSRFTEVTGPVKWTLPGRETLLVLEGAARIEIHGTVRVSGLSSFRAVFVTNSLGVAPVGQIDDQVLTVDPDFTRDLAEAYKSLPWDRI